jgi:branched-chain amino acid transport system permease protein
MIQVLAYGMITGAFYGLAAIGLSLVFGVMRHLNIAHGSFLMIGGFSAYWFFHLFRIDPFLSIPLVMAILFAIGAALYKGLFSHLDKLPEGLKINNSMLVGFGLTWILDNLAILFWTSDVRAVTPSYTGRVWHVLPGLRLPVVGLGIIGLALLVIFFLSFLLSRTYFGKSVRATAQDREAGNLMGINVERTYLIFFALSAALAGVAGVVAALNYSVHPTVGFEWLLKAIIILVLAGFGKIGRVFAAGLFLGMIEGISVYFVGATYREVVGLVIFIIVLFQRSVERV